MNNFERIKQMTVDEMADLFAKNFSCKLCPAKKPHFQCNNCIDQLEQWLLEEYKDE